MDRANDDRKGVVPKNTNLKDTKTFKSKQKARLTKRRRIDSETSSDCEDELPENILETEKKLHASAVKNNLDETGVRKIIKTVVSNDHVFALVKLREEEENELVTEVVNLPKITRSRAKELRKGSPRAAICVPELTPIKHIPVKTRPEVTALIAQDLPEDEDDEEYEPTHDDVPSDDDQTMESCSDLESQPRTPATPKNQHTTSPHIVKDGPFKVPQNVSATKRKLEMEEEEATIARRTRSKLSLSSTSIEHIESTFVPPDDIPVPDVDDLWNQFLNECLNPATTSKNEDDDEADPEYNVAADPDAADEDEDNLSKSIIKISKKELNDLVTELFAIMPEAACEDLAENLANSVLTESNSTEITRWEGKQEMPSDEEATENIPDTSQAKKRNTLKRFSMGKNDVENCDEPITAVDNNKPNNKTNVQEDFIVLEIKEEDRPIQEALPDSHAPRPPREPERPAQTEDLPPPLLRQLIKEKQTKPEVHVVEVHVKPGHTMLPDQVLIFQQQLRQHIQLATSHFLQLFVHPIHWSYAPTFKEYVQAFLKMTESNPNTLANVCNLKPAHELICTWESTVAADTPENAEMVKIINQQSEKCRRRTLSTSMPVLDFPPQFKEVVANSPVFLYPHLLPPTAFRPDIQRRFSYIKPEDELIALGLQEFWDYVEANPQEFKPHGHGRGRGSLRAGLVPAVDQLVKYLLPFTTARVITLHVHHVRKCGRPDNPINKFLKTNKVSPLKHTLLPFNPKMTLYEQPADEIPRLWLKYLAKTSSRIKEYLKRDSHSTLQPTSGVPVEFGLTVDVPTKNPLPIDFSHENDTDLPRPNLMDKPEDSVNATSSNVLVATNLFSVVQTSTGTMLIPINVIPNTNIVNTQTTPIMSPAEVQSKAPSKESEKTLKTKGKDTKGIEIVEEEGHCSCCVLLRKICKPQKLITDYFKSRTPLKKQCQCKDRKFPKVSNRLRLFLSFYNAQSHVTFKELQDKVNEDASLKTQNEPDKDDLEYAIQFQCRLLTRMSVKLSNYFMKTRLNQLFSKFDVSSGDPIKLAQSMYENAKGGLIQVYNEFLGFLTAEQAENFGVFLYYFISRMKEVIRRIDEEISDLDTRRAVLRELKKVYKHPKHVVPSCQICVQLLSKLYGYPQLAKYIFSLFPHKICQQRGITLQAVNPTIEGTVPPNNNVPDDSSAAKASSQRRPLTFQPIRPAVPKSSPPKVIPADNDESEKPKNDKEAKSNPEPAQEAPDEVENDKQLSVVKQEFMSEDELSDNPSSLCNMDENEDSRQIHDGSMDSDTEHHDWTREEDKVLLEIIKQYLASPERKDKSVFQILQEKDVYQLISERLTEKSMDDIVQRVLYLLEVLVVGN